MPYRYIENMPNAIYFITVSCAGSSQAHFPYPKYFIHAKMLSIVHYAMRYTDTPMCVEVKR